MRLLVRLQRRAVIGLGIPENERQNLIERSSCFDTVLVVICLSPLSH